MLFAIVPNLDWDADWHSPTRTPLSSLCFPSHILVELYCTRDEGWLAVLYSLDRKTQWALANSSTTDQFDGGAGKPGLQVFPGGIDCTGSLYRGFQCLHNVRNKCTHDDTIARLTLLNPDVA